MKKQPIEDIWAAANSLQTTQAVKALFLDHGPAFEVETGSISMSFSLVKTSGRQTLFSKDASGNGDGGHIVVFVDYGRINMRIQDKSGETWIKTGQILEAGTDHTFEFKFGVSGVEVYVDDVLQAESSFAFSLAGNKEVLKLGANGWASKAHNPYSASHFMEGSIGEFRIITEHGGVAYALPMQLTLKSSEDTLTIPYTEPVVSPPPVDPPITPPATGQGETVKALLLEHSEAFAIDSGVISVTFSLNSTSGRQALFSKDASGNGDGGHVVTFAQDGRLHIRLQDEKGEVWIRTDQLLSEGKHHQIDLQFDSNGVTLLVDGITRGKSDFVFSLANNEEVLQLGANGWASKSHNSFLAQDFMEGTISSFSINETGNAVPAYMLETPLILDREAETKVVEADDDDTGGGDDGSIPIDLPKVPTPPSPPEENPSAPSDKAYGGPLKNFILTDFNNGSLPENGAGAGYPSVYGEGGSTGTLSLTSDGAILGDALKYNVDTGYIYLQFNAHYPVGRGYAREFAEDKTQDWQFDTYNRMRIWVKLPDTDELDGISPNGAFTGDTNVGTYFKNTEINNPYSDETGGGHPYHHVGAASNGEWTQIVLNWHPSHMRGANGAKDHGVMQYATGEEGVNYFDALTRFYITARANTDDQSFTKPVEVMVDEIEFFQTPYKENDEQVYSIASNFDGDTLTVSWNRHKDEGHIKHEVRYSFENIHEIGWDKATAAPDGLVSPPNGGAYNGMYYTTDNLPLAGQDIVYIAIKPENSDLFTQIAVPLDPDGDGQVNYSDFLTAHRDGDLFEGSDDVVGTEGDDELDGTLDNDVMHGLGGNDILRASDGNDKLYGGPGNDTLQGEAGADLIFTGNGDNFTLGGDGDDTIVGGDDTDIAYGDDGHDEIFGQAGHDILVGDAGDDTIVGGAGHDGLIGWTGDDVLFGSEGDDGLDGGVGDDTLTGGTGADTFNFSIGFDSTGKVAWGIDVITDFDVTQDVLSIAVVDGVEDKLVGTQTAAGAFFTYDGESSVLLLGVHVDDVTPQTLFG